MNSHVAAQWSAWRQRLSALRNIPPVLGIVWASGPWIVTAGIALRIISALIPVAVMWVAKLIVDTLVATLASPGKPPEGIWMLVAIEFGLAGLGMTLGRMIDYLDARLADQFTLEISLRIMDHAAKLDLACFEDPAFYDKLERARVQATDRIGMLNGIGRLLQQTVTLASLSAGVIAFSPWLFAVLVVCVVPAFIGESHFAFLGYSLAHSLTPVRRELDYLRVLGTSREAAKEVKIFGLSGHLRERYAALTRDLIARNRQLLTRRLKWGSLLALLSSAGYYGAYAFLVLQTAQGRLTLGELTFLAGALAGSSSQIQNIFSTFSSIADQALFLTDLHEFFRVQPRIQSKVNALPAPRPIRDGFEFRDVCFHYPGSSRLVLNRLNFRIEPGERVAVVGENGQGKTTLVKLIARLYEPTSGAILLDGVDLREYSVEDLHREIGIIFQDFMRYDMTARANIAVGRIEDSANDALLWQAAFKSRADEIIARLPNEFEQMLGRRFEGGVDLSGGEWQKFALARAYLRDVQVLVLDEPTAALDAAAEYEVFRRFSELTRGRMAILISHRFSTVRMSDRIIVLEGGNIREQGTHHQLVARGGRYARLFEMQAANYR
ncbi:MAG TPA: ABC transporter ATP-binding protein [Bryobacteraceae bacterium]|nr:ABC transporter ATP-binding protein [Bryobacteraceae bacterium]HOQ44381.1 ABC transporter ATP-binding protein [Bryobacteraceae bacterium]HPQ14607.1 ABC transporter ATP-binding protein [Bryobacteraceae bacterium]HPU70700.1 ABC transporter ATP-binding protein [Bryobacteraceae bacterium]